MVYVEASMKEMRQIVEEGPRADLAPDSQVQKKMGTSFSGLQYSVVTIIILLQNCLY